MRSLFQELLHQVGRAVAVYLLVAFLAAGAAVVQTLVVSPPQTDPDTEEPPTSGEPSVTGVRWINPR